MRSGGRGLDDLDQITRWASEEGFRRHFALNGGGNGLDSGTETGTPVT